MELAITQQWNGEPIDHEPVRIDIKERKDGLLLTIKAPYFDDPKPSGEPGKPMWLLWEYEVVEAFFLSSSSGEYLELEFCPHGQHLGLLFKKTKQIWKKNLSLEYECKIIGNLWHGNVTIPWDYLPLEVDKYNLYAIHGTDDRRVYEALYPVPKEKFSTPDYHRLEYFGTIAIKDVFAGGIWEKGEDSIWHD